MHSIALKQNKAFLLIFGAALFLRVFRLDLPFVEPYNSLSRQAIVASVARNFYEHGFRFASPEIDENGKGPYLYNAEMPVYSYLMAIMYALTGGVHEWASRAVSVTFSLGTILLLYLWIRRTDGGIAAAAAAAFAAFSPLYLAISRSVQPDATMLFASAASLYAMFLYVEDKKGIFLVWSGAFMALALATRIQVLPYVFIPWLALAYSRDGRKAFFKPAYIFYWLAVSTVFLWYFAMWKAGREQTLIYSPYDFMKNRGPEGVSIWAAFAPAYIWKLIRVSALHVFLPLGAVAAAAGLLSAGRGERRVHPVWSAWLLGCLVYALIFWRFLIDHSYYQIPFIPPAAYFFGRGIEWSVRRLKRNFGKNIFLVFLAVPLAGASLAAAAHLYKGIYAIPAPMAKIVEAGERADAILPKDALVIGHYGTSSIQLYYAHRKGWIFPVHDGSRTEELIAEFERLKKEGATHLVTSRPEDLKRFPEFGSYLKARVRTLEEAPGWAIYALF